ALTFGYFGLGHVVFDLAYFQTIGMMKEELLAAVPLFIFMGFLTEQAGLMERLFNAFRILLAPIRGALFAVVILTATVFAMATGIVGAAVTVLGIMASPIMIKTGYDAKLAAGCITAGGTLGILIPPSVMLIVMGPVIGVSVAELYSAAFGPGFLLAGIYLVYLMIRSNLNPKLGPPVPKEERIHSAGAIVWELIIGVIPLFLLIAAVLGSMLGGLATPTEASAIGALGAFLLTVAYGKFTWAGFKRALLSTTATSSMVLLLAVTSNIFGAVFARLGTANWITESLLALPFPPVMMLLLVLFLIFLLGWPFEWPAVILVFLPIFYPVMDGLKPTLAPALGIAPDMLMVWFGATVAVVLQTAYLSPPVAMSAYYLKQVVKEWSLGTIYKGMFEFMLLQCVAVVLIVVFPKIVTTFPEQLRAEGAAIRTEEVDDSAHRLEEDPYKAGQEQQEEDDLEKDELSKPQKK
ncbi:MAG TPA: TRAP transporter large permease subunit, partial [Burkholderiales bacterium]|nr:TRAP transporter large permease subunit [Burkholderiales bacterium]